MCHGPNTNFPKSYCKDVDTLFFIKLVLIIQRQLRLKNREKKKANYPYQKQSTAWIKVKNTQLWYCDLFLRTGNHDLIDEVNIKYLEIIISQMKEPKKGRKKYLWKNA